MLLSSTAPIVGAISASDTAANSYLLARDVNDGSSGDRTVILVALKVKTLPASGTITLTYPSAAETHLSVDEFTGVTGVDVSAGATGSGTAFTSGATGTTTQATEILIGAVGAESGISDRRRNRQLRGCRHRRRSVDGHCAGAQDRLNALTISEAARPAGG
jgi:hypothetical protein